MIQAQLAADALARRYPEHEFVLVPLATHGDRHPTLRLTDSAREGVFVKELEQALLDERAELAVHSAKDLPTLPTPGLTLAAFLKRADARDVLIARAPSTLARLPSGSRVGTGSPRRAAQVAAIRPDLRAVEIRGNVDTRLRRLAEGSVDALILASAGLERLGRLGEAHEVLPFEVMLPAPGQGALAIQAVEGSQAAELAAGIDHVDTSRAVRAERLLLRSLGGGRARARGVDDTEVVRQITARLEGEGSARLLRPGPSGGPLAGLRIMVTRADDQAQSLTRALEAEGATAIACPVIAIEPIEVEAERLAALDGYEWAVFTSANGVDRLLAQLQAAGRVFPTHIKVAAIGPQTAARLRDRGLRPALMPSRFIAEDLADALAAAMTPRARILVARAAGARDVLPDRLRAAGARVDVLELYRAVPPPGLRQRLAQNLDRVDMVTFTSSSTVAHFAQAIDGPLPDVVAVACIGPITAQTARDLAMRVDIIAQEYTTRGLVEAIVRSRTPISA